MVLLGFQSLAIGIVVAAFTVIVRLLVLKVIDDLDDPFTGAWGYRANRSSASGSEMLVDELLPEQHDVAIRSFGTEGPSRQRSAWSD